MSLLEIDELNTFYYNLDSSAASSGKFCAMDTAAAENSS
jgi:hypothetical protein